MKKPTLKKLRRLAQKLPLQYYSADVIVPGRMLPEKSRPSDFEDSKYYRGTGVKLPVNHFRRLKKAYKKAGWQEVWRYVDKVTDTVQADGRASARGR